eukprot:gnl/TRDRNA2_/TRDRNA2_60545_c0_seq1.p1 gnl/TRDRNA2_/TRDRNA2_60545_c0~~gnl/TRDRNA2_/TRDRNA2_60545_c0_seq1.p1  ORF type:complete len:318 (+),score=64.32 gnl/TRDRNA2_/TRDRNA2_60545_c0_seq1:53-955(+)
MSEETLAEAPASSAPATSGTASDAAPAAPAGGEMDAAASEVIRQRCSRLSSSSQSIDPNALQALQQLDKEEALRILDEVESKHDLRNTSAFIVSKVQKARLRILLDRWGDLLDREARQLLRSVPTRRAVEVLEMAEAQKGAIRNPSAFICSAVKEKARWPPFNEGAFPGMAPNSAYPQLAGQNDYNAAWAQAAYSGYAAAAAAAAAWHGAFANAWLSQNGMPPAASAAQGVPSGAPSPYSGMPLLWPPPFPGMAAAPPMARPHASTPQGLGQHPPPQQPRKPAGVTAAPVAKSAPTMHEL